MTPARTLIHQLIRKIALTEPLATISEGHLKATLVNGLLIDGHTIVEGSNWADKGRKITLKDGKLRWDFVELPKATQTDAEKFWNSADLRILAPEKIVVELQTRCSLGSQSQLLSKNVIDDIGRVQKGSADLFVFFLDADLYNAYRGVKADNRGRKASNPEVFEALFPPFEKLSDKCATFHHDGLAVHAETASSFSFTRVIVTVERAS